MTGTYKTLYGAPMDTQPSPWTSWERNFIREMQRLREARKMTQTDLARELSARGLRFHQQTVQRIESGDRPVRLNEAHLIAFILGVDLDVMTSSTSPSDHDLLQAVGRLRVSGSNTAGDIQDLLFNWAEEVEPLAFALSDRFATEPADDLRATTRWGLAWVFKVLDAYKCLEEAWDSLIELDRGPVYISEKEVMNKISTPDVFEAMAAWAEYYDSAEVYSAAEMAAEALYSNFPGDADKTNKEAPTAQPPEPSERVREMQDRRRKIIQRIAHHRLGLQRQEEALKVADEELNEAWRSWKGETPMEALIREGKTQTNSGGER